MPKDVFENWEQRLKIARALKDPDNALLPLSPGEVSVILMRDEKTLEQDRREQKEGEPSYLPYRKKKGQVLYLARDVAEYLLRDERVTTKRLAGQPEKPKPKRGGLGFTTVNDWLARGALYSRRIFSVQRNGRPVDFLDAILTDSLSGVAAELSLDDYAKLLRKSAKKEYLAEQDKAVARAAKRSAKSGQSSFDKTL